MIDVKDLITENPDKRVIIHPDGTTEHVEIRRDFDVPDGTTPWCHGTAQLLQGDTREATVRAGESIAAGDVVNVEDGEAYRDVVGVAPIAMQSDPSMYMWLTDNLYVRCYTDSGYYTYIKIAFYQGNKNHVFTQVGDAVKVNVGGNSGDSIGNITIVRRSDSKFMFSVSKGGHGYLYLGEYAGGTLTVSAYLKVNWLTAYSAIFTTENAGIALITGTDALGVYGKLCAAVLKVTDGSLTVGEFQSLNVALRGEQSCMLLRKFSSLRVAFITQTFPMYTSSGRYLQMGIVDIKDNGAQLAAVTPNLGVATTAADYGRDSYDFMIYQSTLIAVYNTESGWDINARSALFDGTALTVSPEIQVLRTSKPACGPGLTMYGDKLVALYGVDKAVYAKTYKVENGSLIQQKESEAIFTSPAVASTLNCGRDPNIGDYCITSSGNFAFSFCGDDIVGEIINESRDAIALDSGGGGQNIRLAYDGTVQFPSAKEGKRIESDGVRARCVDDGWLRVVNADVSSVTGSFKSTETLQTIRLGFTPSLVITYSSDNNDCSVNEDYKPDAYDRSYIPSVLTAAYKAVEYREITKNGFTYRGHDGITIYYIAFR